MKTIFVQIASYRDPECQWTVKDLFAKAKHPDAVNVGLCWQYDPDKDKDCFTESERTEQVRQLRSKGQPSVPSSMAQECEVNPFLRWDVPAVVEKACSLGAASDAPADVFAALRKAKDNY